MMLDRCSRIAKLLLVLVLLMPCIYPDVGMGLDESLPVERPSRGSPGAVAGIALQVSTTRRVVLELNVPRLELREVHFGGQRYSLLVAPGLVDAAEPGQPRLPRTGTLVGLPPTGGWSVTILDMERQRLRLAQPIAPAPSNAPSWAAVGATTVLSAPHGTGDQSIYGTDDLFPSSPVEVGEATFLRDLRVVRLGLHPLRYNPVQGEVEYIRRLVLEVRFEESSDGGTAVNDLWSSSVERWVINHDVAGGWRGVRPPVTPAPHNPPATRPGSFKVQVDADGLYRITYETLAGAGFPVDTVNPHNLHLMVGGQEVAIHVEVGPDGAFTRGDWILFYGEAARSRYTDLNLYWLYSDGISGVRMQSRSVTPLHIYPVPTTRLFTTHYEENHLYDSLHPEASGDHWYWQDLGFLQTNCPERFWSVLFDLPALWEGAHAVTLRASAQGYTQGTHNLKVKVNGHYVGDMVWDGYDRMESQFMFTSEWLRSSDNVLRVENGDCPPPPPPSPPPNGTAFNYFELDHLAGYRATDGLLHFWGDAANRQYQIDGFVSANLGLYDITDSTSPVALTGAEWANNRLKFQEETSVPHRYLVAAHNTIRSPAVYRDQPSTLTTTPVGADYLLVGYGDFLPAAQPLVELRQAEGLTVMSVDVQDVYDEFSYGLLDPGAVRDFLAHVAAEWQVVPTYVVLLGDGTIDYHDYLGKGWHNFLPAYPAYVELRLGPDPTETASDNELDPSAELPIFWMGRLPVASVEQTQTVIGKIVDYETAPARGLWNRRLLFVADNDDAAGLFTQYSDQVYHSLLEPLAGDRIYLATEPTQSHEYDNDLENPAGLEAARAAVRNRVASGRLLVTFMGHSSHSQWAAERLLHRDDVSALQNGRRLPVVLSMTCYTAAFHHPHFAPLDERLVVEPYGGAVAAWGATGAGVVTGHRQLAQGFVDAVQSEAVVTLGAATYAGLVRLYTQAPANRDLIDTYVLLGDPAMPLNRFTGSVDSVHLPLITKGRY